jgi:hypothetical protein
MTLMSSPTSPATGGSEAAPLSRRAKGKTDEPRQYNNIELLGMAESHFVLGAADQVPPNVYRMIGIYRRIVRMWLEPHLSTIDPDTPCDDGDGQLVVQSAAQRGDGRGLAGAHRAAEADAQRAAGALESRGG